jgi:predicted transcriptional regulator
MSDLGELELEVMQLVWDAGEITADQVRERLSRKSKESTVRTVLRRLEGKGYVTHTVDGRTYIFRAAEARQDVAARAVKRIVAWFCNGSVEDVLVGMADARMLDPQVLKELATRIDAAKGGTRIDAAKGER